MIALRVLVLVGLILLVGCGGRLDSRTLSILDNADRVEVFRLEGGDKSAKEKKGRKIDGFPVISQGQDQGREFARKLREILSDKQMHENTIKCFWPGVAFRVWRGEDSVDVLICFKCKNFYCGPPVEEAEENGSFYKTPLHSRLLRLVQEAFPEDKEIQALEDK